MFFTYLKQSHPIYYHVPLNGCEKFYVGFTNRRLETRLNEHKSNENSALYRHTFHVINYSTPKVVTVFG